MPVIKFRYDKFGIWHVLAFMAIAIVLQAILLLNSDSAPTLGAIVLLFVTLTFVAYFLRKPFIPMIKGKSALIISEEKISILDTKQTIYWTEVLEIDMQYSPFRKTYCILFKLKNNQSVKFSPAFFEVEFDKIYNILQNYFREVLLKDGELENQ